MEQSKSVDPELARSKRLFDLVPMIENHRVLTTVIPKDRLSAFLKAGSRTSYTVEKIAGEGEDFPSLQPIDPPKEGRKEVRNIKVQEGHIAVSIESPEDGMNFTLFWAELNGLKPKKA